MREGETQGGRELIEKQDIQASTGGGNPLHTDVWKRSREPAVSGDAGVVVSIQRRGVHVELADFPGGRVRAYI